MSTVEGGGKGDSEFLGGGKTRRDKTARPKEKKRKGTKMTLMKNFGGKKSCLLAHATISPTF